MELGWWERVGTRGNKVGVLVIEMRSVRIFGANGMETGICETV